MPVFENEIVEIRRRAPRWFNGLEPSQLSWLRKRRWEEEEAPESPQRRPRWMPGYHVDSLAWLRKKRVEEAPDLELPPRRRLGWLFPAPAAPAVEYLVWRRRFQERLEELPFERLSHGLGMLFSPQIPPVPSLPGTTLTGIYTPNLTLTGVLELSMTLTGTYQQTISITGVF